MNTPTRPAQRPAMDASALSAPWRARPALASLFIVLAAHVGAIWALQRGLIRIEPHARVNEPVMVELLVAASPAAPATPAVPAAPAPEPPRQAVAVKPESIPKTVEPAAIPPSKAVRSQRPATPRANDTPRAEPLPSPASKESPAPAQAESRATAALGSTENQATGSTASASTAAATQAAPPVQLPSADADYLLNPKPAYPTLSLRLGEKGQVVHRVWIGPDGLPTRAELVSSSGFARLDRVAYETVLRWRYVPGLRNGVPQAMSVDIPINWQLPR